MNFEDFTLSKLRAWARGAQIKGRGSMNRQQLITALKALGRPGYKHILPKKHRKV